MIKLEHKIKDRDYAEIEIGEIEVSDENVRTEKQKQNLEELITSIKRVGLIHPVVLVKRSGKKYELLSGQRRLEAFKQLHSNKISGYNKIPAIVINNVDT